jgi:hypothetical protein
VEFETNPHTTSSRPRRKGVNYEPSTQKQKSNNQTPSSSGLSSKEKTPASSGSSFKQLFKDALSRKRVSFQSQPSEDPQGSLISTPTSTSETISSDSSSDSESEDELPHLELLFEPTSIPPTEQSEIVDRDRKYKQRRSIAQTQKYADIYLRDVKAEHLLNNPQRTLRSKTRENK